MKTKRLLRFYFSVESLEKALDNRILNYALRSADFLHGGEFYAEKICELIAQKSELSVLWRYLDGVISRMTEADRAVLRFYAAMRGGVRGLGEAEAREIKRATVKFTRRARDTERFKGAVGVLGRYYSLVVPNRL